MELFEAMRGRRSAKAFGSAAPSRAVLERIIEAATWAPNHRLTEPWRFFVLEGAAREAFGERVVSSMVASGATESAAAATRAKVVRTPVLLVVAQRGSPENAEVDREDYGAVCAATQNLLLAAHAEGLAAKWSTGEMASMPAALEFLGLGESDRIVALVYLSVAEPGGEVVGPRRSAAVVEWRG